ncbi:MAG: tetratricopeptide repeat protein [Thermoanaerobaculia bacterium]
MRRSRSAIGLAALLVVTVSPLRGDETAAYSFLLAGALSADGDLDQAEAAYAEALRIHPDDPYLRADYAELLAREGRFSDAAEMIARARELAPEAAGILMAQGRIAMARAERDPAARATALSAFDALVRISPDELEAWLALGQLRLAAGDAAQAAAALERAAALRPGTPMIETLRAKALAASGDLVSAEAVLRPLLEADPERLDLRFELAENLSSQGRHAAAEELLAAAPGDQGDSPELRRRRAIEQLLDGDLEEADALAEPLLAEFPENSSLRLLLASIRQADGRWSEVLELIAPLVSRPVVPDPIVAMQIRGLRALGRVEDALIFADLRCRTLETAGQQEASRALALEAAELALEAARPDEAERRARELLEVAGSSDTATAANAHWILADVAIRREDWEAARREIEPLASPGARGRLYEIAQRSGDRAGSKALRAELARGSGDEWLALAEAESRLERFEQAVPLFRQAVQSDPRSLRARFGLAMALERSRKGSASEAEFEKLLADYPDHAPSLNYLAYMRIEAGREVAAAVEMVNRAVKMDPTNAAYVDSSAGVSTAWASTSAPCGSWSAPRGSSRRTRRSSSTSAMPSCRAVTAAAPATPMNGRSV